MALKFLLLLALASPAYAGVYRDLSINRGTGKAELVVAGEMKVAVSSTDASVGIRLEGDGGYITASSATLSGLIEASSGTINEFYADTATVASLLQSSGPLHIDRVDPTGPYIKLNSLDPSGLNPSIEFRRNGILKWDIQSGPNAGTDEFMIREGAAERLQIFNGGGLLLKRVDANTFEFRMDNNAGGAGLTQYTVQNGRNAVDQEFFRHTLQARDSTGGLVQYAAVKAFIADPTNGAADGRVSFFVIVGSTDTEVMRHEGSAVQFEAIGKLDGGATSLAITTSTTFLASTTFNGAMTTPSSFSVTGSTGIQSVGDIRTDGVFVRAGSAGIVTSCGAGESLNQATYSGGIVTGGSCLPSGAGDMILSSTQTSTGAKTFHSSFTVLSGGRDIVLSTDTAVTNIPTLRINGTDGDATFRSGDMFLHKEGPIDQGFRLHFQDSFGTRFIVDGGDGPFGGPLGAKFKIESQLNPGHNRFILDGERDVTFAADTESTHQLKIQTHKIGAGDPGITAIALESGRNTVNQQTGQLIFIASDTANLIDTYSLIQNRIVNPAAGSEQGRLEFVVADDGGQPVIMQVDPEGVGVDRILKIVGGEDYVEFSSPTVHTATATFLLNVAFREIIDAPMTTSSSFTVTSSSGIQSLGDIRTSGVYLRGGAAGIIQTCSGGEAITGGTYSGGIITAGTCASVGAGDLISTSSQTVSGARVHASSFTVQSGGRDIVFSTSTTQPPSMEIDSNTGAATYLSSVTARGGLVVNGARVTGKVTAFSTIVSTVANDNTLNPEPQLSLTLLANTTYQFSGVIVSSVAHQSPEFKFGLTGPSNWVYKIPWIAVEGNSPQSGQILSSGDSNIVDFASAGATGEILINGILVTAGSAGTVTFQWSQSLSSVHQVTLQKYSFIKAEAL